jgi:glutaminyl-peptide cyclotransferase
MMSPGGVCWCVVWLMVVMVVDLFLVSRGYQIGEVVKMAISEMPHDETCFSQGLVIYDNNLYESCGLYGKSSLRIVDMKTGKVLKRRNIDKEIFAEGLTAWNNTLYLASWKNKLLFLYDRHSLELLDTKSFASYNGEGWGLTTDGKQLILSDGSEHILFYDFPVAQDGKKSLTKTKDLKVFDPISARHIVHINELEYVHGFIFANLWYKDIILQINAQSGSVTERYDLQELYPKNKRTYKADVMNGIAYDPANKQFLLTGKLWPKYFRVHFKAAEEAVIPVDF